MISHSRSCKPWHDLHVQCVEGIAKPGLRRRRLTSGGDQFSPENSVCVKFIGAGAPIARRQRLLWDEGGQLLLILDHLNLCTRARIEEDGDQLPEASKHGSGGIERHRRQPLRVVVGRNPRPCLDEVKVEVLPHGEAVTVIHDGELAALIKVRQSLLQHVEEGLDARIQVALLRVEEPAADHHHGVAVNVLGTWENVELALPQLSQHLWRQLHGQVLFPPGHVPFEHILGLAYVKLPCDEEASQRAFIPTEGMVRW
mmetsp:Transcript_20165/g.47597  ORF Transcript_20165/g.47597 Transcript_20165/m.47597 type:complete len:256 (-) Transcript_20165:260-1027(-)